MKRLATCLVLLAAVLLAACDRDPTGSRRPAAVEVFSGNGQPGTAGADLPNPLSVRVTNASGNPVRGATVTWTAGGGGTITPAASTTDASGLATASWKLGPGTGEQTVTAAVEGVEPVTFTATVSAAAAAKVRVPGDSLRFTSLVHETQRLQPVAVDAFGNPATFPAAVTWVSLDPQIVLVFVDGGATYARSVANGRARLEARSGSVVDTVIARVQQVARVIRFAVDVRPGELAPGDTFRITPSPLDAKEQPVVGAVVRWASSAPEVATVDPAGVVRVLASGTFRVTASTDSATGTLERTVPRGFVVAAITTGAEVSCGIASGQAYCWGSNGVGQLGIGKTPQELIFNASPLAVSGGHGFVQVSAGDAPDPLSSLPSHLCGVTPAGAAYCWGRAGSGEIGSGTAPASCRLGPASTSTHPCIQAPALVAGGHTWRMVSAGGAHSCGVTTGNAVYCWGSDQFGQLGTGGGGTSATPVAVAGSFAVVSAGGGHTCALTADGTAWCWGANGAGQLGTGDQVSTTAPAAVATALKFTSISAARSHTCARAAGGAVYCWGSNASGQLGTSGGASAAPVRAGGDLTARAVSAGRAHTCAIGTDDRVYCWGANGAGQLGNASTTASSSPVAAHGGRAFAVLAAGGNRTCAIQAGTGIAFCWGNNDSAALGAGSPLPFEPAPRPVRAP